MSDRNRKAGELTDYWKRRDLASSSVRPEPPVSSAAKRGQWIVCVRDIPANGNSYVGPFHSEDKAESVARRLQGDIDAVGASHLIEAFVEWVQPASTDLEEFRDEMLRDLEVMGYVA